MRLAHCPPTKLGEWRPRTVSGLYRSTNQTRLALPKTTLDPFQHNSQDMQASPPQVTLIDAIAKRKSAVNAMYWNGLKVNTSNNGTNVLGLILRSNKKWCKSYPYYVCLKNSSTVYLAVYSFKFVKGTYLPQTVAQTSQLNGEAKRIIVLGW